MDLQHRLDLLISIAQELGWSVRREPLGGEGGGLCVIKGQRVLFIDTMADLETRYDRTLGALAAQSELEQRYIPPELREDLEKARPA
jgi:hypothetical protein